MKKRFLSMLMALCLMLTLAPAAFAADTSGLQTLIDDAAAGSTIDLTSDYTLTDTVTIDKEITIVGNGHSITYNGNGSALAITATAAVKLQELTINATNNSAYAINLTSNQPDLTVDGCTINTGNRGINMYPVDGCTNGELTINNSTIQNSRVSGDYANNTTIGDTRGISLYDVKKSTIKLTDTEIYGFGYSINISGTASGTNQTRVTENKFDMTGCQIWGWSVLNIWTIGNTFNINECDLRGINPATSGANSFAAIVLNENIYGKYTATRTKPNTFNITGGGIVAMTTEGLDTIDEIVFRIDEDYQSKFNFYKTSGEENPVTLICDKPFSAFVNCYDGMTDTKLETWAKKYVTGPLNTIYNWEVLAPNVNSAPWPADTLAMEELPDISTMIPTFHEGGSEA